MDDHPMPHLGFEIESIITQLGIFAFLVNTLNGQIQVRYKSIMRASPFDTHEGVMLAFLIALFIDATASVAEIMLRARESIYHPLFSYIRLLASGFATILLLVILHPVLGYIISVLWGCLFARVPYESWKELQELPPSSIGTQLVDQAGWSLGIPQ
ncbi:PREDICTED: uncharacterized protein LOC105121979 isoform X2 [Populus euphratica]|uniref:Uncharacterized protein LOC105121979 isoform X2 n=1 Tax=Populus euphratica TaxID=75702 RepID=A0AAJ6TXY2_POPEU|nr:PREDICTED: uncharacterized protein LOC105121979 isoform X2 [Populus euphratica]